MRFRKNYILHATGGKKYIKKEYNDMKRFNIPIMMKKLKRPVGKRTWGVYYRPIDQRTRRRK